MRRSVPAFVFTFVILVAGASVPAEETKTSQLYTVGGERHGASFFPCVDYPASKLSAEVAVRSTRGGTDKRSVAFPAPGR